MRALVNVLLIAAATAFSPALTRPPLPQSRTGRGMARAPAHATSARVAAIRQPAFAGSMRSGVHARMGLFGLGWGEIGVVAVLGLLFFGPERLVPLAKDLGKSASGLKEVADSFSEGMAEGNTGVSSDGGASAIKSAQDETVQVAEVKESASENKKSDAA